MWIRELRTSERVANVKNIPMNIAVNIPMNDPMNNPMNSEKKYTHVQPRRWLWKSTNPTPV